MKDFDYSFLKHGLLPANLINLTYGIASLKTMAGVRREGNQELFARLAASARLDSVRCSNAIEGIVTEEDRIEAIVSEKQAPQGHDEAEIAGYRDALYEIDHGCQYIDFRERDILRLHEGLAAFAGYKLGGRYKTDDNVILEIDEQGNHKVRFMPTPARETENAMEQLEYAYFDAKKDPDIHKLLLIPCVILDFLCIHPLKDCNGRMSRLLSLLLLYKNGYDVGKYISFEKQILRYKDHYYESLRQSTQGWETNENTYVPFIKNFLFMLYMCYKELDEQFSPSAPET